MRKELSYKILAKAVAAIFLMSLTTSCVHEWPEEAEIKHNIRLTVHNETEWLPDSVITLTRGNESDLAINYIFRVYPTGSTSGAVKEFSVIREGLQREDFTTELQLTPGNYDIWVWSDVCDAGSGKSIYYDYSNFSTISYLKPYEGDTNNKDAFRGMTSVEVECSYDEGPTIEATVNLERPFARYEFIATDYAEFVKNGSKAEGTTVKVIYPTYMPSVFNNFTNTPIDSWTGISFSGGVTEINADEALMGMDYVFVNGKESSVQVALEVYDSKGTKIGNTGIIDVPTVRDRTTIIYGKFLTTLRQDGVGIDPDFEGEYNIEIR